MLLIDLLILKIKVNSIIKLYLMIAMITYEEFEDIVVNILNRDISSNKDQSKAISSKANESLFIVAGPGSGKTTVMVLKILKYIFVDDILPNEILSTTFTKKAADELYSRILSWGDQIKNHLLENITDFNKIMEINRIDFNQINVGTTDSIAEELLRVHKDPGTNLPVVIEDFVAKSAMTNSGLLKDNRYLDKDLREYLSEFSNKEKLQEPSQMSEILLELKNRIYYDEVDFKELYNSVETKGSKIALEVIADYENELKKRNIIDFAMLESEFLKKLKNNKLKQFLDEIKIILIDEYQDTNLIQEDIYFTIAKSALKNGGNLTVVGDDDQSLYRFRGATVDLFTNFKKRAEEKLGIEVEEINLKTNYRSTKHIINHCNHFVELDKEYQNARVYRKPKIIAPDIEKEEIPVLGLFRNNPEMLANDLARLIDKLINKGEVDLKVQRIITKDSYERINKETDLNEINKIKKRDNQKAKKEKRIKLKLDSNFGSAADIAVLCYSPKEMRNGTHTFNYYLRKRLKKLRKPIEVFNPRGQDLQEVKEVSVFCGLILECIDPKGAIQKLDKQIPALANRNMKRWRYSAIDYIKENPEPHKPISLKEFVNAWQELKPIGYENDEWPKTASLMELAYKIITWIEPLQSDVEGIVYLEAITKSITQTGFFNEYSANISFENAKTRRESVLEAIWNIFIPIATGGVKIDESLLETLPDDRINIMSIHQSKGLEFPLVIVDVGSRFKDNKAVTQKFRFPKLPPKEKSMEDTIREYSTIGESKRDEKDRAFDDLTRLYFVAFSRAENVLLLVGLNQAIDGYVSKKGHRKIPNVALGWSRDENFVGFDEIYLI